MMHCVSSIFALWNIKLSINTHTSFYGQAAECEQKKHNCCKDDQEQWRVIFRAVACRPYTTNTHTHQYVLKSEEVETVVKYCEVF